MTEKEMQEFAMRITKPGIPHSDEEIEKVLRRVPEEDAATIWVLIRAYRKVGHNRTEGEFKQYLTAQCQAGEVEMFVGAKGEMRFRDLQNRKVINLADYRLTDEEIAELRRATAAQALQDDIDSGFFTQLPGGWIIETSKMTDKHRAMIAAQAEKEP
jgi:hypothetical protein